MSNQCVDSVKNQDKQTYKVGICVYAKDSKKVSKLFSKRKDIENCSIATHDDPNLRVIEVISHLDWHAIDAYLVNHCDRWIDAYDID